MADDILFEISQFAKVLEGLLRHVEQNDYDLKNDDKKRIVWSYMQKITR